MELVTVTSHSVFPPFFGPPLNLIPWGPGGKFDPPPQRARARTAKTYKKTDRLRACMLPEQERGAAAPRYALSRPFCFCLFFWQGARTRSTARLSGAATRSYR